MAGMNWKASTPPQNTIVIIRMKRNLTGSTRTAKPASLG